MTILAKKGVEMHDVVEMDGVVFVHGHKEIRRNGALLVIGHEHPSMRVWDTIGASLRLPCFLYNETHGIVVIPPLSPMATGTDVTFTEHEDYLSPILRAIDMDAARVYAVTEIGLLDFKCVGDIRGLWELRSAARESQ